MREKRYRYKTKILGIPVPGFNHPILPSVEMRKWQFIENLLMAATRGLDSCIFEEGALVVEKQEDGSFKALMSASSGGRSISGVAGGRYFESRNKVEWTPLKQGLKYFLYIVSNTKTVEDPRRIRAVASRYRQPTSSAIVTEVDLSGEKPQINIEPYGKSSRRIMESHVGLTKNPHGKTMFQDELGVKNLAIVGSIEIDEDGPLNKEGLKEASSVAWRSYRVESAGKVGVKVEVDGEVMTAVVSFEDEPIEGDALWVGYHGTDVKASSSKELIIYNRSTKSRRLRVAVLCKR